MPAGRPRIPGTEAGRTPIFKFSLPAPLRAAILAELSQQEPGKRQTLSDWIREAMAEKLKGGSKPPRNSQNNPREGQGTGARP